jgi:ABC-type nitrate/sulfonate/bicarbonate transport system substrate-binding protein
MKDVLISSQSDGTKRETRPRRLRFPNIHILRLSLTLIVSGLLVLPATGCGDSGTTPKSAAAAGTQAASSTAKAGLQQVDLIMDWIPWVLDIPIDVAQARGFYRDEGLSVEQTIPATATDVVKFVSTGKAAFGLYYSPDMLMALEEGAPLLSIGSLMAHAPVGIALGPGLTPGSPSDLKGRTVSVPLIPSTRASFATMLGAAGVDASDVNIVDPGFELVAPLLQGTVDAAAFTQFGELVQAQQQGKELSYLDFRDWGTPDYAFLDVITTQEYARSHPDTVRAFAKATFEGLASAAAHPEEAVEIYVKAHPEFDPILLLAQWKAASPSLAEAAGNHPAGWQDSEAWGKLNSWMVKSGLLKKAADIGPAVTNAFLNPAS